MNVMSFVTSKSLVRANEIRPYASERCKFIQLGRITFYSSTSFNKAFSIYS